MNHKIQYISQGSTLEEHFTNIQNVLNHGVKWVQLRVKDQNESTLLPFAEKVKTLCLKHNAIFIINDFINIAKKVDADGVHLGLEDDSIAKAREILGENKIIGGTANTFFDVKQRSLEKCDYIGLGPYKFTSTKKNLSPVLGIDGYTKILDLMNLHKITIPIYAIGGIQFTDIPHLFTTKISGIAISSLLTQNPSAYSLIKQQLTCQN